MNSLNDNPSFTEMLCTGTRRRRVILKTAITVHSRVGKSRRNKVPRRDAPGRNHITVHMSM